MSVNSSRLRGAMTRRGFLILDGGLATHLEQKYCQNLKDPLWSAKLLCDSPDLIRQAHLDFYRAGADIATTASYQASIAGFMKRGFSEIESASLLKKSVQLASEAREIFWEEYTKDGLKDDREYPFIAASIGSYGAYLANGAEFTGEFGFATDSDICNYHRQKIQSMRGCGADVFACETIPCMREALILERLFANEFQDCLFWISFSCSQKDTICSGEPLSLAWEHFKNSEQALAFGMNCTHPDIVLSSIQNLALCASAQNQEQDCISHTYDHPKLKNIPAIVTYANGGGVWDAVQGKWSEDEAMFDPRKYAVSLRDFSSPRPIIVGGCCRVCPESIAAMRLSLISLSKMI